MTRKFANFVYLAAAIISIAFIKWSAPTQQYKPQGIVLPASSLSAANFKQVLADSKYKPLATIHVQYHYKEASEQNFSLARNYARQLAKNIGAKGLLERQPMEDPVGRMVYVNAIAIQ
jgi:hypothetical protein